MRAQLLIATRYLFARKGLGVINAISWVSTIGMAIGTAALVMILSVYNGFDGIIRDNLSDIDPDVLLLPAEGKSFVPAEGMLQALSEEGASVNGRVEEKVFFRYGEAQGVAAARGVDESYLDAVRLSEHVLEGSAALHLGDIPLANLGSSLAWNSSIHPRFTTMMEVYFPDRYKTLSPLNPMASLHSFKVKPASVFSITAETDESLMLVPIEEMRSLLGYSEGEVSALEIRGTVSAEQVAALAGDGFLAQDRFHQHPSLYKMMRYEKAAIFLILLFVVIIIAFNIFGSLSMLIINKQDDIATLRAMGADNRLVRRIFTLEGWMVSLLGLAAGLVVGVGAVLLQQATGIIKMPGNYLVEAYPVALSATDVLLAAACIAAIGLFISAGAVSRRLSRRSRDL